MPASVASPADIINIVLASVGHPGRVGHLYDGSAAAKKALDVYAETRDELLRAKDWPFAFRQIAGSAAPTTVSGWAHSFAYPADCIRVRSVSPNPIPSPNYDPAPLLWELFNDQTQSPPIKVILTQVTPVFINYIGQITSMATWEPLFVNALVERLAMRIGPALRREIAPSINASAAEAQAAMADEPQAPNDAAPAPMAQPQGRQQ